jgi:hypothetical protein
LGESSFDDLLREVLNRVRGVLDERARWELLLDAVVTMGADVDLDSLLARIVDVAGQLVGAQLRGTRCGGPERRSPAADVHPPRHLASPCRPDR